MNQDLILKHIIQEGKKHSIELNIYYVLCRLSLNESYYYQKKRNEMAPRMAPSSKFHVKLRIDCAISTKYFNIQETGMKCDFQLKNV